MIGTDDVLSIVYWKDKDMSADAQVRPDGRIALPLINEVQAAGLTPEQLHKKITEESKKYMEDANITVVVREINSRKVFITGEVNKPGPYPLTSATTVMQLISMAGGLREYANSKKIMIMRNENGQADQPAVQLQGSRRRQEPEAEHRAEARRHGGRAVIIREFCARGAALLTPGGRDGAGQSAARSRTVRPRSGDAAADEVTRVEFRTTLGASYDDALLASEGRFR